MYLTNYNRLKIQKRILCLAAVLQGLILQDGYTCIMSSECFYSVIYTC